MDAFRQKLQALRWPLLICVIIGVGLVLRVYKAWTMRYTTSLDFGTVALAAKHMTEGRDYPTFFYGQAYMGNVEPAVTAILCRLFGLQATAFMVHLGTALVGILLLPLLYVCARDAGGRRAGLIAMLYCLVGSDTNFHYAVAGRCGYMTMMVTDSSPYGKLAGSPRFWLRANKCCGGPIWSWDWLPVWVGGRPNS